MLHFNIVTLFPEFFASPLETSLLGRFRANGGVSFSFHNPRDHAQDRHRHVDDTPYGGGPGMVMQAPVVAKAIESISEPGRIAILSPAGRPLTGAYARELARFSHITLVCGRYEGIDSRIEEHFGAEAISIGDFVLNGGETGALAVIEAVCRFAPGFLGKEESASEDSFDSSLLEYPHYTRPVEFAGRRVPDVLMSGDHARIAAWRREESLRRTLRFRPDLLARAGLSEKDAAVIRAIPRTRAGRNLGFCLIHWPVKLENGRIGASSLTNLDVHDIARISRSYGLGAFYVLIPVADQLELANQIVAHWQTGPNRDRAEALSTVRPVASFEEMRQAATEAHGIEPIFLAASAQWPKKNRIALAPSEVLALCAKRPVIICLGTARGLSDMALASCDGQLAPLRYAGSNHLPVRSAAAIIADRILGDFN